VRVDFINILVAISSLSPGQCCIIKEHDEEVYMVTNGEMRVRAGSFFVPVVRLRDGQEDGICPDQKVIIVGVSAQITRND
jgi:hypothetical protein